MSEKILLNNTQIRAAGKNFIKTATIQIMSTPEYQLLKAVAATMLIACSS